jgi:hypothetical protein
MVFPPAAMKLVLSCRLFDPRDMPIREACPAKRVGVQCPQAFRERRLVGAGLSALA